MKTISAMELQRSVGRIQDEALVAPVAITRHGREHLVILSAAEYRRLKSRDRQAMAIEDLPEEWAEKIGDSRMDARHAHLDELMD